MLRSPTELTYVPILTVRPAEMVALRELPDLAKDRIFPHIILRPWLNSNELRKSIDKIQHAYSKRPWIVELDDDIDYANENSAWQEMQSLQDPENGFANWIKFVSKIDYAIPALQVSEDSEAVEKQIMAVKELGRGAVVRFPVQAFHVIPKFADFLRRSNYNDMLFILDFGQADRRILTQYITAKTQCDAITARFPEASIVVSATTFPFEFSEVNKQAIFEREFFSEMVRQNPSVNLIYSDRGSARAERLSGGGAPMPRIDLPSSMAWRFFREEVGQIVFGKRKITTEEREAGYRLAATRAIADAAWDPKLNIWGTQLIKLTQIGADYAINAPVRATAARINIHLFRQAIFGYDGNISRLTEDDWSDDL
ncbi:hypothetical protein G6L46_10030 [Agrobacterium rhizogenes]|uniref:beta family protein n=1 Tax=Rhizobium rhizogenes TaxID=359 RepID=UPI001571DE00|nr:hypothetical protein [Rhizobium rhizogenes]NTF87462.1 hypothetical protein [Rhizobium rhizogenes]